jgi:crossover junction endodeoxyribonuclease RuvC
MKILGIDPGLSETGWAILNAADSSSPKLIASGLIRTLASQILPRRLVEIHEGVRRVIAEHTPDSVAIEEMFFLKAAHTVRATLQARGVIVLAVAQAEKSFSEYNPRSVKLALTGSGTAIKSQMQWAIQRALKLKDTLRPADVADAAAIALCHIKSQRISHFKVLERLGNSSKEPLLK